MLLVFYIVYSVNYSPISTTSTNKSTGYSGSLCTILFITNIQPTWKKPSSSSTYATGRGRARSEPGGTRWRMGGEVKGKLANGVGSQYSHATSERGLSSITQADAHTSAASSWLNWRPHRFKWTRPFRGKTKSGFCACAITFRTSYTV